MWGTRQVLLVIFCLCLQWYNEWECEGSQDCIVMGEMILIERQSWLFWCKYHLCDAALSGSASKWCSRSLRPISCIRLKGQMSSSQQTISMSTLRDRKPNKTRLVVIVDKPWTNRNYVQPVNSLLLYEVHSKNNEHFNDSGTWHHS